MKIRHILETSLYASDLEVMEQFYRDILGLTVHSKVAGRHVFFKLDSGMLLIFNAGVTGIAKQEVPAHGAEGPGHVAFAVAEPDLERWRTHLDGKQISIEREINWPNGGRSLYFRDPAGNSIELVTPSTWNFQEHF